MAGPTTASPWRWPCAAVLALLLHALLLGGMSTGAEPHDQNSSGPRHGAGQAAESVLELRLHPSASSSPGPASVAAAATEPGEVGGGGRDGYYARVRAHLQRHRQPLIGSDVRGTAVVAFHVAADGRVSALVLQRSAGAAMLDAEALDLVHRASPLPPPPDGRARRLAVPIAFE